MSAVKRIERKKIIAEALGIIRGKGMEALNARSLAARLGCSTRPIYLSFKSMDELKSELVTAASEVYGKFAEEEIKSGKYPQYKAYGMGYIRFAKEEKQLFSFLFMRNRSESEQQNAHKEELESIVKPIMQLFGADFETAYLFHTEIWIFVHGIASMLATSYLDLSEEQISGLLTDAYEGLKVRFFPQSVKEKGVEDESD